MEGHAMAGPDVERPMTTRSVQEAVNRRFDNGFVGTAPGCSVEQRQVPTEFAGLMEQIVYLEQAFGQLRERLGPAVFPRPQNPRDQGEKPSALCDLAQHIRGAAYRLSGLREELAELTRSIEL